MLRVKANLTFFLTAVLTLTGCGAPESAPAVIAGPEPAQRRMLVNLVEELRSLFPDDHPITPHPWVADFLVDGETVVWQGTRQRAGRYSIGRRIAGLVLSVVVVFAICRFAGISLEPLRSLLDTENPAQFLIPIGVVTGLTVYSAFSSFRKPDEERAHAVTDRQR